VTVPNAIPPSLRGQYAGFVSRAIALIIDLILVVTTQFIIIAVARLVLNFFGFDELGQRIFEPSTSEDSSTLVSILRWLFAFIGSALLLIVYLVFFWTLINQSLGQILMGVRVLRTDGRPMTLIPSIRRIIGYYLAIIPLGLGFLWVLIDDRRQGWHDKLADTVVIYGWDARVGRRMEKWLAGRQSTDGQVVDDETLAAPDLTGARLEDTPPPSATRQTAPLEYAIPPTPLNVATQQGEGD
jgi:uncharacterized RDD family membrane protein YckC